MKTTIKLFGMPILTIQKETTDKAIESLDKGACKSIGFTYLCGDGFTNLSCCKKQCENREPARLSFKDTATFDSF